MKVRKSFIIGIIITLLLLIGALVAYYLSQRPQEVRQHAGGKAFGRALVFDGTTTVVRTPQRVYLKAPFTIEGWIKPDYIPTIATSGPELIFASDIPTDSSCNNQLYLGLSEKQPPQNGDTHTAWLTAVVRNNQTIIGGVSDNSFLPFDHWGHVAITADTDGTIAIFVNGKKTGVQKLNGPVCINSNFAIGGRQKQFGVGSLQPSNEPGYVNAYKGQMDEIRISNSVRYSTDFTPSNQPFSIDPQTSALAHLDGTLTDEFSSNSAIGEGSIIYVDSSLPETTTPPACQPNVSTCEWDAVDGAVSYHYKITRVFSGNDPTPAPGQDVIAEGDVQAPATSTTFVSEDNKTYTCEVSAVNSCGTGGKASVTAMCAVPTVTPTPIPSSTPVPTNSPTPTPTSTPSPTPTPTTTPVPPTPTNSPTPTPTTPPVPTSTPVPTNTLVPTAPPAVIATATPTPTLPSPGSPIVTITITSGVVLTIIGALLLFAL